MMVLPQKDYESFRLTKRKYVQICRPQNTSKRRGRLRKPSAATRRRFLGNESEL